jgi:uncharacterized protein YlaI
VIFIDAINVKFFVTDRVANRPIYMVMAVTCEGSTRTDEEVCPR